jgi:hypothetical protein
MVFTVVISSLKVSHQRALLVLDQTSTHTSWCGLILVVHNIYTVGGGAVVQAFPEGILSNATKVACGVGDLSIDDYT